MFSALSRFFGSLKQLSQKLPESKLSAQVIRVFALIALLGLGLISTIAYCVIESGRAAESEFRLLQASSLVVDALDTGRALWTAANDLRRSPRESLYKDYSKHYQTLIGQVCRVSEIFKELGIKQDIVSQTRISLEDFDRLEQEIYLRPQQGDRKQVSFKTWKEKSNKSLHKVLELLNGVHVLIAERQNQPLDFKRYSQTLNYLFLAANAAIVTFSILWFRALLSTPLISLSKNCNLILRGELIPESKSRSENEVKALEEAFRLMSISLAQEDARRRNFQELFQKVLVAALQNIGQGLDELMDRAEKSEKTEKNKPSFAKILRCKNGLKHLILIVNSLSESLNLTRGARIAPHMEDCRLNELIDNSTGFVEALIQKKKITLAVSCEKDLHLRLDKQLIQRVITNFLSNAIKYSPYNAEIRLSAVEDCSNASWTLAVFDNGPGISEEGQKMLFKKFSQLKAADGIKREGTGLGLLICKDIVEAHGGSIECRSQVGEGSEFRFSLPQKASAQETQPKDPSADSLPQAAKTKTITRFYSFLLLIFIFLQSTLFFCLNARFQDLNKQSAAFSLRKERLLRSQEIMSILTKMREKWLAAFDSEGLLLDINSNREMEQCIFKTQELRKSFSVGEGKNRSRLETMLKREQLLLRLAGKLQNNSLSKLELAALYGPASSAHGKLVDECFAIMEEQRSLVQRSYEVGSRLRIDIFLALSIATVLATLMICLAASHTLSLVGKLMRLSEKAAAFAQGKIPLPDLEGNDEMELIDKRLCESAKTLMEFEESRQNMLATINHDIRTPLSAMIMTMEILSSTDLENRNMIGSLSRQTSSLYNRLTDFLLLEKLQHGSYRMNTERIALDEIVDGLCNHLSEKLELPEEAFRIFNENAAEDLLVDGDKELIGKLFEQVLLNSCLYGNNEKLPVSINWQVSEDLLELEIENSGGGLTPELERQIFERFRIVDGKPLLGFGLCLASEIAKLHKAKLVCSRNSQQLCAFKISLARSASS